MPAPDRFRDLLREHLAPGLRTLGFVGSGSSYALRVPDAIAILGIQRSRHNDAGRVAFTINLTAGPRRAWDEARAERPWLPQEPAANSRYPGGLWQSRIGMLMPSGRDTWWEMTARTDLLQLADEVLAAVRDHALPALREHAAGGPDTPG